MKRHTPPKSSDRRSHPPGRALLLFVLIGYLAGFWLAPDRTRAALNRAVHIVSHLAFPLTLVFLVLVLTNRFLRPEVVGRLLGRGSGVRGLALAALGGVLSHGPIFAWYPLLRDLRDRGAGNAAVAVFLCNRAGVKPFLLPVMVGYFGWPFVACLTGLGVVGAVFAGMAVAAVAGEPEFVRSEERTNAPGSLKRPAGFRASPTRGNRSDRSVEK